MHKDIQTAVDNKDKLSLKYYFCDCLDGDPTFEKYQEDYDYCVRNNALFEAHRELNPMVTNHVDEEYWVQLKNDFMENPSKERLAHMREVAKILYKDRIARIQAERDAAVRRVNEARQKADEEQKRAAAEKAAAAEAQRKADAEAKQKAAAEAQAQPSTTQSYPSQQFYTQPSQNTGVEGVRRVSERRPSSNTNSQNQRTQNGGTSPKKASGAGCIIPLLVLAAIVIIVVLIVKNQ